MPLFAFVYWFSQSLIFPRLYSNFGAFMDSFILFILQICCISNGKLHILVRWLIRHFRPYSMLSSKSFKNDSNYKHSWSAPFLSSSIIVHFSSNTIVIISLFGVPLFCFVNWFSQSFIFRRLYSNFATVMDWLILWIFQICCISCT